MSEDVEIRPAQPDDAELILSLIRGLAEYERSGDSVKGTPELLREGLFGAHPHAEVVIAERGGEPVGFAMFFGTFSTWECRPGLYLEDLFVVEPHRRTGIGEALFAAVARTARERGCARLEWVALRWNEPALRFYERLGSEQLEEWVTYRLDDTGLRRLSDRPSSYGA